MDSTLKNQTDNSSVTHHLLRKSLAGEMLGIGKISLDDTRTQILVGLIATSNASNPLCSTSVQQVLGSCEGGVFNEAVSEIAGDLSVSFKERHAIAVLKSLTGYATELSVKKVVQLLDSGCIETFGLERFYKASDVFSESALFEFIVLGLGEASHNRTLGVVIYYELMAVILSQLPVGVTNLNKDLKQLGLIEE